MKYGKHLLLLLATLIVASTAIAQPREFKSLTIPQPPLRFAIIGDRTGGHVEGIYEEIVAEVEEMKPDFVLTVGDHIEGYTEDVATLNKQWDEYFSIIKPLTMPLYITPGNHDITSDPAEPVYIKRVGPPYYSFDVNKYHFIVLDVSRFEASGLMPHDQLQWLIDDLSKNIGATQTLVFFHKPLWYNTVSLGKPDTLHALFVNFGVDAVFNGHFHRYFSAKRDGILYTAVGSSGGEAEEMPHDLDYHFTWVTLDKGKIDIAPIEKGAVTKWDLMTDDDLHTVEMIAQYAVKFPLPLKLPDDLIVKSETVKLELRNLSKSPLKDTVRWDVPDNWTVTPSKMLVEFKPSDLQTLEFQVSCDGNPYPLPTAHIRFPYGTNKTTPISVTLRANRTTHAVLAANPPVIDGILNDACWQNPNTRLFSEKRDAPVESTWIYFAYDRDNLYYAAHCRESHMDSLRAKVAERDGGVYGEDCVGFYLQPNMRIDTAYQFYVNPLGTIFDQKLISDGSGGYNGEKSWNGTYVVKTVKGINYWDAEVCIPLAQFAISGIPEQALGINFMRKQKHLSNAAEWQAPRDYNPKTYGVLIFE